MARPLAGHCPVCGCYVPVWIDHTDRLAFVVHGPDIHAGDQCEASCWIAEDDELIPRNLTRKVRSDAGRARPSRRKETPA